MGPVKPWREKEGGKGNRQGQASIMRFLKDSGNPVPSRLWWTFPWSQSLPLTAWSPALEGKGNLHGFPESPFLSARD